MMSDKNEILQEIYSQRSPYVEKSTLSNREQIIFDDNFIELLDRSFLTDCVSDMNEKELDLLYLFIAFQDGVYENKYVVALDQWLVNIANSVDNPKLGRCS